MADVLDGDDAAGAPDLVVVGLADLRGHLPDFVLARHVAVVGELHAGGGAEPLHPRISTPTAGASSAGALIGAIPVVVIFLALQKYLVGGLTAGAVKG
ncbi:MAG: hypothetical protein R2873_16870 [Caldilineaceae bacterium]